MRGIHNMRRSNRFLQSRCGGIGADMVGEGGGDCCRRVPVVWQK